VVAGAALIALLIGAVIALTRGDGRLTPAITAESTVPAAAVTATSGTAAPVTPPPTTVAVATVAPTAAPSTAAVPATPAPATAATTVPTIAPPAAASTAPTDRAGLAESFLRGYYSTVAARDYDRAWSMLTPDFQATTGGYAEYTSFWNTIDRIDVRRVQVQPAPGGSTWPIVATLSMRYTLDGRVVDENDQLTLEPDTTGAPRIARYRVVGGA